MADDLEPVSQSFEADLGAYVEPIRGAADETQGFADVVKEAGETLSGLRDDAGQTGAAIDDLAASAEGADASLEGMAVTEDDTATSTETLAEAYKRFRDEVYETNPGIDDATASLLAEAAAMDALGISTENTDAAIADLRFTNAGMEDTLRTLRSELGALDQGMRVLVTKTGLGEFLIQTDDELQQVSSDVQQAHKDFNVTFDDIRKNSLDAAEAFTAAGESIDNMRSKMYATANLMKDFDNGAKSLASDLEGVVTGKGLGGGGGFIGILSKAFGVLGGGGDSGFSFGTMLGNLGSLAAGALVAAPAIAALVVELGGLVGTLAILGGGIAAFMIFALPFFDYLKNSSTRAPLPWMKPLIADFDQLKTVYQQLAGAFEPDLFRTFDAGIKMVEKLLPGLLPIAQATAGALTSVFDRMTKAFTIKPDTTEIIKAGHTIGEEISKPGSGQGFKQWTDFLKFMQGPIISTVATDLGKLGGALAKDFESFSKKDYINAINDAFNILIFVLGRVTYFAHNVMNMWDDLTAAFKASRNWFDDATRAVQRFSDNLSIWYKDAERDVNRFNALLSGWYKDLEHDFDQANSDVNQWGKDVGHYVMDAGHDIEHYWDDAWNAVVSFTESIPGRIVAALGDLGSKLFGSGQQAINGLIQGMESRAGAVLGEIGNIASLIPSGLSQVLHQLSPSQVMRERGQMAIAGLELGLYDGEPGIRTAMVHIGGLISGASLAAPGAAVALARSGGGGAGAALQLNTAVTVQLNSQTLLRSTQSASRRWNRGNVTNSLALRAR